MTSAGQSSNFGGTALRLEARPESLPYLPKLDGLRAFAVLAVMFYHASWLKCGWAGVQGFFVLSGFLITQILLRSKERRESIQKPTNRSGRATEYFATFYWRRMLRIFPLYYAFIFVLLVIYFATGFPAQLKADLPWLLTYTTNIQRIFPGYQNIGTHSHLWSLAVEEQFYLIWPAVIWIMPRLQLRKLTWGLIVAGPSLRFATGWLADRQWQLPLQGGEVVYNLLSSHLDAFAAGAAVAMGSAFFCVHSRRKLAVVVAVTLALGMWFWLTYLRPLGVTGFTSLGYPHDMPWHREYVWGYSLWNLIFALLIATLLQPPLLKGWDFFRFFEFPIVTYLGRISYGLYIFHDPIQLLAARLWHVPEYKPFPISALLFSIASTIAVAAISFHWLERRFLIMKDRKPRWGALFSQGISEKDILRT